MNQEDTKEATPVLQKKTTSIIDPKIQKQSSVVAKAASAAPVPTPQPEQEANRLLHYKSVVTVRYFPDGHDPKDDAAVLHEDVSDCIDIWEVSKFYNDCQKPNDKSWA